MSTDTSTGPTEEQIDEDVAYFEGLLDAFLTAATLDEIGDVVDYMEHVAHHHHHDEPLSVTVH